ncbi:MAG TPA: NAD(P)H-hydrate dehydratase, partial [Ktedonobacterales bacterium]|nr:NAD(P)H-hydrate dehydratase [Ktedonobacterales bacterium]
TSPMLMEHAGRSVAEAIQARLEGEVGGVRVVVLAGPGNNGGDGRVAARYLAEWGAHVSTYDWKQGQIEADGQTTLAGDDLAGLRSVVVQADIVLDALLGTGHARPLAPTMAAALSLVADERQRRPELYVVAVDLPSGLNADTGAIDPGTLAANLTVTLALPKIGLLLFPGASYVGELQVGSIGLPATMSIAAGLEMLDDDMVGSLLPPRPLDSNKGTFGKMLALSGSPQYIGAAYLVCGAAARIGAGLVTLATLPELAPFYATMLPEITYAHLPPETAAPEERARAILDSLEGYRALVIGPGLGQSPATIALLEHLLAGILALAAEKRPSLIVDADGLNNLAKIDRWWQLLPPRTILTPHPGEMSRLCGGVSVSGGGADRIAVARQSARDWGHVVVLKGACTLIASPEGALRINGTPNPALASAGTGDVLAGTVAGLLAQGVVPFDAASTAVYLHALAGLRVSAHLGDAGLLAGDLLPELPLARQDVLGTT